MISCVLAGGLGNQLFEIATTWSLAKQHNDECAFNFDTKVVHQGNTARAYRKTVYKKLKELSRIWKPEYTYKENDHYEPIPYHKNMLIDGYFSQLYFQKDKKEIVELFKDQVTLDQIRGQFKNSVSVHVRRGDYLSFPKVYVQLPMSYYTKALSLLEKQKQIDRIYVLSDDIKWCKKNFNDDRIEFIQYFPDYVDLYILSKCENNIMANSSFSWWGTYLNENPNKIVYAPKKWFGPKGPKEYECLFCDNFIRI
jgi:hypothetical protein